MTGTGLFNGAPSLLEYESPVETRSLFVSLGKSKERSITGDWWISATTVIKSLTTKSGNCPRYSTPGGLARLQPKLLVRGDVEIARRQDRAQFCLRRITEVVWLRISKTECDLLSSKSEQGTARAQVRKQLSRIFLYRGLHGKVPARRPPCGSD